MKEIYKQLFVLLLLISATQNLWASNEGEVRTEKNVPSPNAVALAKYGDIPMSSYTGTAQISIPIFSTNQRGVALDVNLFYDTSGIMARSLPSWTGYGWALNAGGVITRVEKNLIDELDYSALNLSAQKNYFYDPGKLKEYIRSAYGRESKIKNLYTFTWNNLVTGTYDYTPDVFYFNFMGKTGRFFYGNDAQWHVLSDANLKVEFNVKNKNNYIHPYFKYKYYADQKDEYGDEQPKTIKGFTIIDEDGTRYIFGDNSDSTTETDGAIETRAYAIEYTIPFLESNHKNTRSFDRFMKASAWYLTEVRDRFGTTLYKFDYERGKFIMQINKSYQCVYKYGKGTYGVSPIVVSDNLEFPYSICLNSPVYLKSIEIPQDGTELRFSQDSKIELSSDVFYSGFYRRYGNNIIEFLKKQSGNNNDFLFLQGNNRLLIPYQKINNNKGNDPLASMAISPLKRIELLQNGKTISFRDFSYYNDEKTRLLMKQMSILDCDEKSEGKYDFSYYSGDLPRNIFDVSMDDWGHYTTNTDGSPNLTSSKFGMLSQIAYPTGGVTEIQYGLHQYSKVMSDDRQSFTNETGYAGGLRVESIANYSDASKKELFNKKVYTYTGGELFAKPRCCWLEWKAKDEKDAKVVLNYYRDNSIVPLCNSFGSHIGYSEVTETLNDSTYNVYKYTNLSSFKDDLPFIDAHSDPTPFDSFTERGYMRGKLLSESHYSVTGELMSSITNTYRSDISLMEKDYTYDCNLYVETPFKNQAWSTYCRGGITKMFYPKYDIVAVEKKIKYGDKYITDYIHYDKKDYKIYDPNSNEFEAKVRKCISMTEKRENLDSITTQYSYPVIGTEQSESDGIHFGGRRAPAQNNISEGDEYCHNNFFYPCIKTTKKHNGQTIGTTETNYGFKNGMYVPIEEKKSVGDNSAYTYMSYDSYLSDGRLETFTELGKCQSKLFYDSKKRLVARVTCAAGYSDVVYNENATSPSMVITKGGKSIFEIPTTEAIVYTYDEKGMLASITKGAGNTQYYIYDNIGQLSEIRDRDKKVVKKYSNNVVNK